jgi:ABC-type transport system substrate-binding protein
VDKLIEIGMTEPDQDKRRAAYKEAQEIISEEAPWVVMFVMPNLIGSTDKVENLAISPLEMTLVTYETTKK